MNSKQLRERAWNALKGRYFWSVLAALIAGLFGIVSISTSTSAVSQSTNAEEQFTEAFESLPCDGKIIVSTFIILFVTVILVCVAMAILGSAVKLGYCRYNMNLFTDVEKPTMNLLFSRLGIVWKALWKSILEGLLTGIGCIFFLVPGIIISLMYSQSDYILAENPNLTATEAMKRSREMMKGQKWNYFKLMLSFIGWAILAGMVPAGELLLAPYTEAASAAFYLDRTDRLSEKKDSAAEDQEEPETKNQEEPETKEPGEPESEA